jgi:hypothetical protein
VNFGQMRDITLTMSDRRNEAGEIMLVKQHLNDTYRECQNALRLLSTTYAITSTGAADYSLVALGIDDIQSLRSVAYTGTQAYGTVTLDAVGLEGMLGLRSVQGATPGYTRAFQLDGDTLRLDPTPSSGETITLYATRRPDEMSADDDEPEAVPAEYHRVIVDGAIAQAARTPVVRSEYASRFEQGLAKLRWYASRLRGDELASARFGGRRRVPHDPSYYGGGWA